MASDHMARQDFGRARRRSFLTRITALLTGKSADLLALADVMAQLPMTGQHDIGSQPVPLDKIVGSEGRYRDFDRAFMPRQSHTKGRWVSIDRAQYEDIPLPPVVLYKVGDAYFVRDGNHRVSVARERGQDYIDAYVTEIEVPVPLSADADREELIRKHDYVDFLQKTHLKEIRPDAEIDLTLPGQYGRLLEHIDAHRWYLGEHRKGDVPYREAVASWYDNVYMPVVRVIREHDILREFPKRTEADLYLWIIEHMWYLREQYGRDVPVEEAAAGFAEAHSERPLARVRNALKRLFRR